MVVTHPQTGGQLNIGLDVVSVPRLRDSLEMAEVSGCDFVIAPLTHPRYERAGVTSVFTPPASRTRAADGAAGSITPRTSPPPIVRDEPLTRSDMELTSGEWMAGVFAKLSPWIRPDCPHPVLRAASEKAFAEEVAFAAHVSLKALIIPPPNGGPQGVANLARCISAALAAAPSLRIWLRLPVVDPPAKVPPVVSEEEGGIPQPVLPSAKDTEPWETWNVIRTMCGEHPNLGVALELTGELNRRPVPLDRWVAEPVRVILVSTDAYATNKLGYPVLPRKFQDFIKTMFKMRPFFALTGMAHKVKGGEGYRPFVQYLAHLFGKMPGVSEAETFEAPYYDYLQAPLQPLSDNLESQTYETFERDPVKYASYEEAVRKCLLEKKHPSAEPFVVMVLGAGRGPLVKCVLRASDSAGKDVTIYAVEKNPNAIVTLRNMKKDLDWENVTIVASDMRDLEGVFQADIIVSELLGSFGDNELSPECLDGANNLLKKDGVSIPCSYTSFLAPLSSTKLHNEVKAYGTSIAQMETAYVVKIHRGRTLAKAKPCFTFEHPNRSLKIDNTRYTKLQFKVAEPTMMHGFAGYFETVLYGDVKLSINPETFSEGMFSWFPLYFPLATPVYCSPGETINVNLWRRLSRTKCWYEWNAQTDRTTTAIHNPQGRSYSLGLQ